MARVTDLFLPQGHQIHTFGWFGPGQRGLSREAVERGQPVTAVDRRGVAPSPGDVTKLGDNVGHADAAFQDGLFLAGDAVMLEMQFVRDAVTDPIARRQRRV